MRPDKTSSFRWLWVISALLAAVALVWLCGSRLRPGEAAEHAGPAAPSASAAPRRSAPRVDVTRRPRATISGHVADAAEKAVADAMVCAWVTYGGGLTTAQ